MGNCRDRCKQCIDRTRGAGQREVLDRVAKHEQGDDRRRLRPITKRDRTGSGHGNENVDVESAVAPNTAKSDGNNLPGTKQYGDAKRDGCQRIGIASPSCGVTSNQEQATPGQCDETGQIPVVPMRVVTVWIGIGVMTLGFAARNKALSSGKDRANQETDHHGALNAAPLQQNAKLVARIEAAHRASHHVQVRNA